MTHATIGAEVDQTLDRKLDLTTEIAFNGELGNGITDAFEFSVCCGGILIPAIRAIVLPL